MNTTDLRNHEPTRHPFRLWLWFALALICTPAVLRGAPSLDSVPRLQLEVPAITTDAVLWGTTNGTIYRVNGPWDAALMVTLRADPVLLIPSRVTIPPGVSGVTFPIGTSLSLTAPPLRAEGHVSASAPGYIPSSALVKVDGRSPTGFHLEFPAQVALNRETVARVRLDRPLSHDLQVSFQCSGECPALLPDIIVPAGRVDSAATFFFPAAPGREKGGGSGQITVTTDDFLPIIAYFWTVADPSLLDGIQVAFSDGAIESGVPAELWISFSGATPLEPPILRVISPNNEVVLDPDNDPHWTPGSFPWTSGTITLRGAGDNAMLELQVGSFTMRTNLPPVVNVSKVPEEVIDLAESPGDGGLLALQGQPVLPVGNLLGIDATTGTIRRRMPLPAGASSLSVSIDGSRAWILSDRRSLFEVDVSGWSLLREVKIPEVPSSPPPAFLLAVGTNPDRVLVGLAQSNAPRTLHLVLLEGDRRVGPVLSLPVVAGWPISIIRGSSPEECILDFVDHTTKVAALAEQLRVVREVTGSTVSVANYRNAVSLGDTLWRGHGRVFRQEEMTFLTNTPVTGALAARPRQGAVFGLWNGTLFCATTNNPAAARSHPVVRSLGSQRLLSCTGGVFAATSPGSRSGTLKISLFKSPLAVDEVADLEVVVTGNEPIVVPWYVTGSDHTDFRQHLQIINRGPGTALQVTASNAWGLQASLPVLRSGESWNLDTMRSYSGTLPVTLTSPLIVSCALADPYPTPVSLSQEILPPPMAGRITTPGKVYGMAASRMGDTLAVLENVTASLTAPVQYELQVRSASTGAIEQRLLRTNSIMRFAVSEDGSYVFAALGQGVVRRWNSGDPSQTLKWTASSGAILDLAPLPGHPGSLLVVATDRVAVFDDDRPRPTLIQGVMASDSSARVYEGTGWLAGGKQLSELIITADGVARGSRKFSYSKGFSPVSQAWQVDGARAYLRPQDTSPAQIFDLQTGTITSFPELYAWLPVPEKGAVVGVDSTSTVVYDAQSFAQRLRLPYDVEGYPAALGLLSEGRVAYLSGSGAITVVGYLFQNETPGADLQVSVSPSANFFPGRLVPLVISVTNHSDQMCPAVRVVVSNDVAGLVVVDASIPFNPVFARGNVFFGDLPPRGSASMTMNCRLDAPSVCVEAHVYSPLPDPVTDNNSSSACYSTRLQADPLLVSFTLQTNLVLSPGGRLLEIRGVMENRDVVPLTNWNLALTLSAGLEILSSSEGAIIPSPINGGPGWALSNSAPLLPAERRSVSFTLRGALPGWHACSISSTFHPGMPPEQVLGYVAPEPASEAGLPLQLGPVVEMKSNPVNQRLLLGFPAVPSAVVEVDPVTLAPLAAMFDAPAGPMAAAGSGSQVWVADPLQGLVKIDVAQGKVLRTVPLSGRFPGLAVVELAIFPGDPESLVALMVDESTGLPSLLSVSKGSISGQRVLTGFTPWQGHVGFASREGVWYSGPGKLIEYSFPSLVPIIGRDLSSLAPKESHSVTMTTNLVVFDNGRLVTLVPPKSSNLSTQNIYSVIDPGSRRLYSLSVAAPETAEQRTTLNCMEPEPQRFLWAADLPPTLWAASTQPALLLSIHPMPGLGARVVSMGLSCWIPEPSPAVAAVDIHMQAVTPTSLVVSNGLLNLGIRVENETPWPVSNGALTVTPGPGIQFAAPGLAGAPSARYSLGDFARSQTIGLELRTTTLGETTLRLEFTNDTAAVQGASSWTQSLMLTLHSPVTLLLADREMRFGSSFAPGSPPGIVPMNLSTPATEDLRVEFNVIPGAGTDPDDHSFSWIALFRWANTGNENVFPVARMPVGRDRQYLLQVMSSPVPVTQSNFVLTVVGDFLPTLQVAPAYYFVEGIPTGPNRQLELAISDALPMAAEFEYSFEPIGSGGSAVSGQDFLPLGGKVIFPPGVTSARVDIPILDDTEREADEAFAMRMRNPVNLILTESVTSLWIIDDDPPSAPIVGIKDSGLGLILLEIDTEGTATYRFEQSSSLGVGEEWRPLGTPFKSSGVGWRQKVSVPVSTGSETRSFYRVLATP